jgi:hypothetical protein
MNTIPYGRKQGKVKFFNCQKGYGFIIPHNLGISEKVEGGIIFLFKSFLLLLY